MILRFRAEPGQPTNLRIRIYSQDRSTLLLTVTSTATVDNPVSETIEDSGSYECEIGALTGDWFVVVDFIDTGEVTADGFASEDYPEVVDFPSSIVSATIGGDLAATITADVLTGLSAVDPAVIHRYNPRTNLISITRGDDLDATSGTHVDIPINLPTGVDGDACTVRFGAVHKEDSTKRIDATVSLVEVASRWYVRLVLTSEETTVDAGAYDWSALVIETVSGRKVTVVSGDLDLAQNVATPAA